MILSRLHWTQTTYFPTVKLTVRDEYCVKKAQEKGIPTSQVHNNRSAAAAKASGGYPSRNAPFNAFREMENIKEGRKANLAIIQDNVHVVGKAIAVTVQSFSTGSKRPHENGERVHTTEVSDL